MCFQVSVATRHHLKHCVRPACSGFAPVVAGSAKNASPAPKGVRLISHPLGAPMFARALLAFLVLPCVVAVLAPPLIAFLDPWRGRACTPGLAVMLAGAIVLLWCVRDFYVSGKGTLAPWDPPEKLVVIGLYRYVRNPMYVGVLLLVFGWAMYFSSLVLAAYFVVLAVGFHIRVVIHEEPWLKSQFSEEWHVYSQAVSRWLPRVKPWKNGS